MFFPHPRVKISIAGSLRDREVACSASDLQGLNFESCVRRAVSPHHPQEVLLARFSLYVHKSGLKPDLFHFHRDNLSYSTHYSEEALAFPDSATASQQCDNQGEPTYGTEYDGGRLQHVVL